jgi:hypothetical protein
MCRFLLDSSLIINIPRLPHVQGTMHHMKITSQAKAKYAGWHHAPILSKHISYKVSPLVFCSYALKPLTRYQKMMIASN